jgi:hypothetical protein
VLYYDVRYLKRKVNEPKGAEGERERMVDLHGSVSISMTRMHNQLQCLLEVLYLVHNVWNSFEGEMRCSRNVREGFSSRFGIAISFPCAAFLINRSPIINREVCSMMNSEPKTNFLLHARDKVDFHKQPLSHSLVQHDTDSWSRITTRRYRRSIVCARRIRAVDL